MFKHPFDFDPTYGYSKEDLLKVGLPEAPPDFDAFWQQTYAENEAIALNPVRERLPSPLPGHSLHEVSFSTLGGIRVGAWLFEPEDSPPTRGLVIGHGYGGRESPETQMDLSSAVAIFPCAPGFNLSASPGIPGNAMDHVIHGIEGRESYIIRSCVASLWSAASVLLELHPGIAGHLYSAGVSFGGGLGALALPWDKRFAKAQFSVPTFGHHPLRLKCRCGGSGKSVASYHREHPEVIEVLRYYDAATAAARITIPVLSAPALFDPVVPPPGQFAVCNALPGGSQQVILSAGHFEYPEMVAEYTHLDRMLNDWFGRA